MTPSEILPASKKMEWNEGRLLTYPSRKGKTVIQRPRAAIPTIGPGGEKAVSSLVSEGRTLPENRGGGSQQRAEGVGLPTKP